jgi:hypothetical protein
MRTEDCDSVRERQLSAYGPCGHPASRGTRWPDVIVAAIMAALALQGAAVVARQAAEELRRTPVSVAAE